jgi:TetR/AcrR family transcriptional regulator, lmrAB and yxaGH operons repressor
LWIERLSTVNGMARPDHSRQRLVATAARLLRRQGYAATGLKQVLAESGTSSGSLYHHFPGGKEDLAVAAVQASAAAVTAGLARLFDAGDACAAVTLWLDAHIAELRRDARDGCPVAPVALEAVTASPPLRAATAAAFETWITLLATSPAHGRKSGLTGCRQRVPDRGVSLGGSGFGSHPHRPDLGLHPARDSRSAESRGTQALLST